MAISLLAPAVLATAAAALAVAFAPAAAADRGSDSRESGRGSAKQETRDGMRFSPARPAPRQSAISEVPKGWLNEAQWARPGTKANPFGGQPKPPVFALD